MIQASLDVLEELLADRGCREFSLKLDEIFRGDPNYTARKQRRILEGAARGERIVRFEDRYVISSFVPPLPSRAFLTFVQGGVDRQTPFTDLAYARRSAPLTVHLCITSRCPYRCEHCGTTPSDGPAELTTRQWIGVIGELQDLRAAYIAFSGGEPLLRPDVEEILRAVDDRSTTLLFTNGMLLTAERARSLKAAGLFYLAVSLDSADPDDHNRFRRNPHAFADAVEAVENASAAGLYTLVSAVVFRKNVTRDFLFPLFRLAKQHGAHEVRVHQPLPRGELTDPKEPDQIFWTPHDVKRLYEIQFAANEAEHDFPKVSSFPFTEGPCKFGCGAGVLHSYISSNGELWPCDFVPLTFGNVLTEGCKEVYRRMIEAAGIPRNRCLARHLAAQLIDKKLPLDLKESTELCRGCRAKSYPDFFRNLQRP